MNPERRTAPMSASRKAPPANLTNRNGLFDLSSRTLVRAGALALLFGATTSSVIAGPCPEQPSLFNFQGPGQVVCPCFIAGEEAGVVLTPPVGTNYPIEVIRVGIAWGSQFGGAPTSLESAIHIYDEGLPNPGAPLGSLPGPQLTDGFINEFNLEDFAATVQVDNPPFSVTLEFLNTNAGDFFAPTVVHDGSNNCQLGKNLVKAIPGGWNDACLLGVTGNWVMFAVYRELCATDAPEQLVSSAPLFLATPRPNPFQANTEIAFVMDRERSVDLAVFDLRGRRVAQLAERIFGAGAHTTSWDGRTPDGSRAAAGVYFVALVADGERHTQKVVLTNP